MGKLTRHAAKQIIEKVNHVTNPALTHRKGGAHRVGHARDGTRARPGQAGVEPADCGLRSRRGRGQSALAGGAVHKIERNPGRACEDADLILLGVPFLDVRSVLEAIAPALKVDAVVVETAPLKMPIIDWAAQGIPRERHLVGAYLVARHPIPDPPAPLYEHALMIVVAPHGSDSDALEFTTRLAPAVGASTLFSGSAGIRRVDGWHAAPAHVALFGLLPRCDRGAGVARCPARCRRHLRRGHRAPGQRLDPARAAAELAANRETLALQIGPIIKPTRGPAPDSRGGRAAVLPERLQALMRTAIEGRREWMVTRSDPRANRLNQDPEMPSARERFARMFGMGKDQLAILRGKKGASTPNSP